ncbi:hypothetical protein HDK77DRAFT_114035 [Phyllosticta capitalensis]|uniref:Uncharacterized protein n=1 Tax=Phyllosticta capitalensis TaxID=121624 RepID=A0ABR1YPM0_9PEZI
MDLMRPLLGSALISRAILRKKLLAVILASIINNKKATQEFLDMVMVGGANFRPAPGPGGPITALGFVFLIFHTFAFWFFLICSGFHVHETSSHCSSKQDMGFWVIWRQHVSGYSSQKQQRWALLIWAGPRKGRKSPGFYWFGWANGYHVRTNVWSALMAFLD